MFIKDYDYKINIKTKTIEDSVIFLSNIVNDLKIKKKSYRIYVYEKDFKYLKEYNNKIIFTDFASIIPTIKKENINIFFHLPNDILILNKNFFGCMDYNNIIFNKMIASNYIIYSCHFAFSVNEKINNIYKIRTVKDRYSWYEEYFEVNAVAVTRLNKLKKLNIFKT